MSPLSRPDYLEQFQTVGSTLPGADLPWLASLRQTALAQFGASGFPSPRDEDWKYTNVAPIEKKRFSALPAGGQGPGIDPALIERYRSPGAWTLTVIDGMLAPEWSELEGIPADVLIAPISRALSESSGLIESALGRRLENERHGFIAFNTAFFREGLVIRVPAGRRLTRPVQLLHVASGTERSVSLRNLILIESGAEAQVVETFIGESECTGLCTSVSEVVVEDHASVDYYSLQHSSDRSYRFGGTYASVGRAARFRHTNLSFGGLLDRNDIHVELAQAAECTLDGLFLGRGRQHVDNHTLIHHRAPNGTSRETYRGILADRSRGVFHGRIIVHPDARKTDARMNNRNLLLSDDAEIDTKPQLEIHADDVKCAHGVAIGRLDEKSVFYLQSRGVDTESARNMLTFAFANAMLENIALPSVKNLAQDELMTLFPQAEIRRDWL